MFDFLQRVEVERLIREACIPLVERITYLEAQTDEWVNTKIAMRLTGRSADTLRRERDRKGTLIEHGKDGTKNLYSRSSLIAYAKGRILNRERPSLIPLRSGN